MYGLGVSGASAPAFSGAYAFVGGKRGVVECGTDLLLNGSWSWFEGLLPVMGLDELCRGCVILGAGVEVPIDGPAGMVIG